MLPDYSAPHVSLQINGLTYYYVITKDAESDAQVYVRNEDTVNGGYIFDEVDDWSGLPGNSFQLSIYIKHLNIQDIPDLLKDWYI